ncbi:hypothetical protein [Pseudomonas profundi]|uniref:hypothetical protein n=1 Tax=Pseudomonas profundi TaxID=1981513 RepID=UPI001238FB83|nr:hypothetical protein [Pseudomonas profundi]
MRTTNSTGKYGKKTYVGGDFSVRFRMRNDNSVEAQWSPRVPTAHELETLVSTFEYTSALVTFIRGEVQQ